MALKKVVQQLAIDGVVYPRGEREFSDAVMQHKHFHHYVKAGYIVDVENEKREPAMTAAQKARHEAMLAKVMPPKLGSKSPFDDPDKPVVAHAIARADESKDDEALVEAEAKKKHPKGK
jgi:hypothetical protein